MATPAAMALAAGLVLMLAWHHGVLLAVIAVLFGYLTHADPGRQRCTRGLGACRLAGDLPELIPLGGLLMLGSTEGIALAPFVALIITND